MAPPRGEVYPKGPLPTSCATAVLPGVPTTALGLLWGCGLSAESFEGVVASGAVRFMGEAQAGSPFFNRTICLRNSGVSFTCNVVEGVAACRRLQPYVVGRVCSGMQQGCDRMGGCKPHAVLPAR